MHLRILQHENLESRVSLLGLFAGLIAFIAILNLDPFHGLSPIGMKVLAVSVLMLIWWVSEALPLAITALLPIITFPALKVYTVKQAAMPYASPVIFFFIGGFMLAIALEKSGLHKRLAMKISTAFACNSRGIIGAFIAATAFVSLWVSNSAAAMMMLPIGMAVVKGLADWSPTLNYDEKHIRSFASALMLAIAFSATIGGIGTLIGTPSNLVFRDYIEQSYGIEIDFWKWLEFALPLAAIMLAFCWLFLTYIFFPHCKVDKACLAKSLDEQKQSLKPHSMQEVIVGIIFLVTVFLWALQDLLSEKTGGAVNEATISIACAILLFALPADKSLRTRILDWKDAAHIPWGIVILFGGGLCLGSALSASGVAEWIGGQVEVYSNGSVLQTIILVAIVVTLITEVISNLATLTAMLPIMAGIASHMGLNPLMLAVPATISASFAFMLPAGTPPNAIAYGSHFIKLRDMMKVGLALNLVGILVVAIYTYYIAPSIFGFAR